jgi:hypothetical protein
MLDELMAHCLRRAMPPEIQKFGRSTQLASAPVSHRAVGADVPRLPLMADPRGAFYRGSERVLRMGRTADNEKRRCSGGSCRPSLAPARLSPEWRNTVRGHLSVAVSRALECWAICRPSPARDVVKASTRLVAVVEGSGAFRVFALYTSASLRRYL